MRVRKVKNVQEKLDRFSSIVIKDYINNKGKWKKFFNNNNPVYLEVGSGKGQFLIKHATLHPEINYIGLEKEESVVYKAALKISNQASKLPNLILISADAINIRDIFSDNEVSKIYLNFSDPWPKSKHEKRRLTSDIFLNNMLAIVDGTIEFKTDNITLFEYSIMQFNKLGLDIIDLKLDLHSEESDIITTEYEDKFTEKGNRIYYAEIKRKD